MFDGATLKGWNANPAVWSVEDGAITAASTPERMIGTSYIIWDVGEVGDFEWKLEVKLDGDSKDELAPRSVNSRWEDRNNDGVYETGTTFVDGLVFPRFVTPLGDGVILTKESNAGEVWKYSDTNKDGVADKRELFTTDFGRSANVEHQEAELTWLMDNWMYDTRNAVRLRWTPNGAIREPIGNPGGSWGITQDDDG